MFCPRCGAENELKQGYCRQCGQALADVRLVVEGSADQSLEKLKASREWINAGSATLVVFTLIGLAIAIIGFASGNPILSNIALLNLLLGSAIGLPLVFVGKASLKRAARLLSKSEPDSGRSVLDQPQGEDKLLTSSINKDMYPAQIQGSVTEHTTLNLKESDGAHRKPS